MRGTVTPALLLDAARSLDEVREPKEADAERARTLLLTLNRAATQGALLPAHKNTLYMAAAASGLIHSCAPPKGLLTPCSLAVSSSQCHACPLLWQIRAFLQVGCHAGESIADVHDRISGV
jgi:hypothetical protein